MSEEKSIKKLLTTITLLCFSVVAIVANPIYERRFDLI